jgi:starch phosphorylase
MAMTEDEQRTALAELALDMNWCWNRAADGIWRRLDPALWDATRNPWLVLQTISREHLAQALADPELAQKLGELAQARHRRLESPRWFQHRHPEAPLTCVAYFSMEFMLSEALPIYSGGLGNVAGDQLKAAADLGVPVVGVGLLYQQGYFRQVLGQDEVQQALYPFNDPGQLPIKPVREANGEWLRLEIALPGYSLWLRAWEAVVGSAKLYLLDTNDPANSPAHRGIASELYGGGPELRLEQEIVLGIGGWRLLGALGLKPEVCHLNEGHAALIVLERAQAFMHQSGQPFKAALVATRAGNLFTTHTAVPAGFDRFAPAVIEHYLGGYARDKLGLSVAELLALGRENPSDTGEDFTMAYLAIRGSAAVNGVSRLHGQVSRRIFSPLFPRWPEREVPIGHVTNGIHVPSWISTDIDKLWAEACGEARWTGTMATLEEDFHRIPAAKLWQTRTEGRRSLVEYTRRRVARQLAAAGAPAADVRIAQNVLDPNVLTLGFARRFATYKRPNLLLHDRDRLLRLLGDGKRPVQLIIAGKAHPADLSGQAMISEWLHFIRHTAARSHVVFLEDYDMRLAANLVSGVDVWINTPRRPWEACGTSGMKVLANGGINLSELDGWWEEAYAPEVGWALGDGRDRGDDPAWDAAEAEALFGLLEREVVPAFYNRDSDGIPVSWVDRMRESMARLTPRYSANRAVREYTELYYLPAAAACRRRVEAKGALAAQLAASLDTLREKWPGLRFGELLAASEGPRHVFEVQLYLGDLDPDLVRVELYAEGAGGAEAIRLEMPLARQLVGALGGYVYAASAPADRPAGDYTPRALPRLPDAAVPLEAPWIFWRDRFL